MLINDGYFYHMPYFSEDTSAIVCCKADMSGTWHPVFLNEDGTSRRIFTPFNGCKHCCPVAWKEDENTLALSYIVQTQDGSYIYKQIQNSQSLGVLTEEVIKAERGFCYKNIVAYTENKKTFNVKIENKERTFDVCVGEIVNIVPAGEKSIIVTIQDEDTPISIIYSLENGKQDKIIVNGNSVYKCCLKNNDIVYVKKGESLNERSLHQSPYSTKTCSIIQETTNSL